MSFPLDALALKEAVMRVLADEVAPTLQMDRTAIEVLDVDAGVVRVRLHGGCGGCPSSIMTVLMGLEQELRQRIPELEYLEVVP
jgi:Fe-S cluster biogenesis protein NfuA